MTRRKRRVLVIAASVLAIAILSVPFWGMHVGRRLDWFRVERVEISGVRLVAPHEILAVSGIGTDDNVLDDPSPWLAAIRAHPVLENVQITRRLPGTLRIRVREKAAVALVADDDALLLATAAGEILPVDPASVEVDLPIVHGSFAHSAGAASVRRALDMIGHLADLDPDLMAATSEALPPTGPSEPLRLVHTVGDILVPAGIDAERLAGLDAVLHDLARSPVHGVPRGEADPDPEDQTDRSDHTASVTPRPVLDLRFADQVVVRRPPTPELF